MNKNQSKRFVCNHVFSELTSVCPLTRLPDFYTVSLTYEPDALLVELKSLKMYFISFRDVEILHEEITSQILDKFISTIKPRWVNLSVRANNRGGIVTVITRRWSREYGDEIPEKSSERGETGL
ncbi:MAG: preQ(1) synthase [Nitrososphaerota archaeon]|nr:preQ(1) synthase [Nitrososphaerota archaeon]